MGRRERSAGRVGAPLASSMRGRNRAFVSGPVRLRGGARGAPSQRGALSRIQSSAGAAERAV